MKMKKIFFTIMIFSLIAKEVDVIAGSGASKGYSYQNDNASVAKVALIAEIAKSATKQDESIARSAAQDDLDDQIPLLESMSLGNAAKVCGTASWNPQIASRSTSGKPIPPLKEPKKVKFLIPNLEIESFEK